MRLSLIAGGAAAALLTFSAQVAAPQPAGADSWTPPPDPYIWLEDVNGDKSMAWVNAENAKTVAVLQADKRFDGLYQQALAIAESKDRLPYPNFLGGDVYNFWQDADHVRGIWRKTSLENYSTPDVHWTTALDLDALAKAENANWYIKGETCLEPSETRCLISLSDGGEDAVTIREFDVPKSSFVDGGFILPRGKQREAWEGHDSILLAREWNPKSTPAPP